jgi:hypothetical protein
MTVKFSTLIVWILAITDSVVIIHKFMPFFILKYKKEMLQFYLEVYQNILSITERTFSLAALKNTEVFLI